jgi:peptide deformylase
MFLPIVAYGDAILRKKAAPITKDYPELATLIENMWDTMEKSRGVGLAAPQINKSIRLFVIDSSKMYDEGEEHKGCKEVFINAEMIEEKGEVWKFEEGCLSIPGIREDVLRKPKITIKYFNEKFEEKTQTFDDLTARVIQHEYDHIEGKLFIDHIKPIRKSLLKSKLENISKGKVDVNYRMKFPLK